MTIKLPFAAVAACLTTRSVRCLAGSRPVGRGPLPGRILRRLASLLFAPLRKSRRRLPPQDDYLRRDIGLPELEELPQYWDFTRYD